jgi:hypothetical protein
MIVIHATLEDLQITAERRRDDWWVRVADYHLGKTAGVFMSDTQLGAVLALSTAGDEWAGHEDTRDKLYEIARTATDKLPADLCPIP